MYVLHFIRIVEAFRSFGNQGSKGVGLVKGRLRLEVFNRNVLHGFSHALLV